MLGYRDPARLTPPPLQGAKMFKGCRVQGRLPRFGGAVGEWGVLDCPGVCGKAADADATAQARSPRGLAFRKCPDAANRD